MIIQQRLGEDYSQKPEIESQFSMIRFMETEVLSAIDGPITIAFDEVDRVFGQEYQADFFTMLRCWHNNRRLRPV